MPSRMNAIVTCSCGWRVGDVLRFELTDEQAEVEKTILRSKVVQMYRHYQLGHRLTGKSEFRRVIEDEALKIYERESQPTNEGDRR